MPVCFTCFKQTVLGRIVRPLSGMELPGTIYILRLPGWRSQILPMLPVTSLQLFLEAVLWRKHTNLYSMACPSLAHSDQWMPAYNMVQRHHTKISLCACYVISCNSIIFPCVEYIIRWHVKWHWSFVAVVVSYSALQNEWNGFNLSFSYFCAVAVKFWNVENFVLKVW